MEPFVPERDERISANRSNGPQPKPQKKSREATYEPPKKTRAPNPLGKLATIALAFAFLALLALFALQHQNLASLQAQFSALQSKIDTTDESLNQSGAALGLRLQKQEEMLKGQDSKIRTHFSEIDKLWAARKKINESLSELDGKLSSVDKKLAGFDKTIASTVNENKTLATKLRGDVEALRREVLSIKLGIEGIEAQNDKALAKVATLDTELRNWRAQTDKRLASTEEAIRAIDAFRRSTNAELLKLRGQTPAR